LFPQIFKAIMGFQHDLWGDVGVLLVMGFVFFSLVFLVPNDHRFLVNHLGDFLGKISYSLYLLHEPVLWQAKQLPVQNTWLLLVIFLSLSVLVAALSYFLFENPARLAIRRWQLGKKNTS
jgi:peptidoglycan/LPS O-acetylase OafA/YrhL